MGPVLGDTSVLARLLERDSPKGRAAEQAVRTPRSLGGELAVCPQVLTEFWVVATRPLGVNGYGLKPSDADACIGDFLEAFVLLPDPSDLLERWREIVVKHAVRGKPAHDARLVAALRARRHAHRDVQSARLQTIRRRNPDARRRSMSVATLPGPLARVFTTPPPAPPHPRSRPASPPSATSTAASAAHS